MDLLPVARRSKYCDTLHLRRCPDRHRQLAQEGDRPLAEGLRGWLDRCGRHHVHWPEDTLDRRGQER
eukprot:12884572-Prorocentrum_lima.AAC.1